MKSVDTIAWVRRAFHVEGWSLKRISRELQVSRNTVRRILQSNETFVSYERAAAEAEDRALEMQLDALLDRNLAKPQRERLTQIRIYEELCALGYEKATTRSDGMPRVDSGHGVRQWLRPMCRYSSRRARRTSSTGATRSS